MSNLTQFLALKFMGYAITLRGIC